MTFFLLLASIVLVPGFVLIAHGLYTAPEGYEDELGFHALPARKGGEQAQAHAPEIAVVPAGLAMHS